MKNFLSCLMLAVLSLTAVSAKAVELKIATIAPQGTALFSQLQAAADDIKAQTSGRVSFKIYGGAVLGEDKEIVGKMRYGEIDGAALTGIGLGIIDPEIRALELPFLFENQAQVDKVYSSLEGYFQGRFKQKGFELLGWSEVGFIKIFSNKPIRTRKDLSGKKMWMWEGDLLAKTMYEELGVTPIPLSIADVLSSLQTNIIDVAYSPELGALAFQWQTATKYMTDVKLINGTGGIVLTSRAWKKIPAKDQKTVMNLVNQHSKKLVIQTRQQNKESKQALQSAGIEIVTLEPKALEELKTIGQEVRKKLVGKLYSQTVLDKIDAALK